MKVTACVVSWNSGPQLAVALDSLLAQRGVDLHVAVVDNASRDGSAELARDYGVEVLANRENRGYAGAANQAVELATRRGCEAVLLANFDVRLDPRYVERAVAALAADPLRASVQGKLLRPPVAGGHRDARDHAGGSGGDGDHAGGGALIDTTGHVAFRTRLFRNRGEGERDDGRYDTAGQVFGTSGALALYRLEALADIACGGEVFDTDLFAFWEDVDIDWRLQLRGWRAWYEPGAVARHERGGAGPRRSARVERLNFTNRFLVVCKNDAPAALARALPGVALTSGLKATELALTVPSAFARSLTDVRLLPRALARRRAVQARATVAPEAVVARWFETFDYAGWVRTWWQRVSRERTR